MRSAGNSRSGARWFAVVLAALLSFTWQSIVTQTHVHPGVLAAAGHPDSQLGRRHAPPESPADCPIGRLTAQADHYLSPAPIVIAPPAAVFLWLFVPLFLPWTGRRRSHAWHSRGPPHPLQA